MVFAGIGVALSIMQMPRPVNTVVVDNGKDGSNRYDEPFRDALPAQICLPVLSWSRIVDKHHLYFPAEAWQDGGQHKAFYQKRAAAVIASIISPLTER